MGSPRKRSMAPRDGADANALAAAERWAARRLIAPGARARVADAVADGYGVALLIHAARPDLLRHTHAFEPGRAEAARNWAVLEARALRRLGVAAPPLDELLRGRDATRRRDHAARFLLDLRRALKQAPIVPRAVTPRRAAPAPPSPPRDLDGAFAVIVQRVRRAAAGHTSAADARNAKSTAFDDAMGRLRIKNKGAIEATARRIATLKLEVARADVKAARFAREARSALVLDRQRRQERRAAARSPVPRTPQRPDDLSVDLSAATLGLDDDLSAVSAPSVFDEPALAPPRASLDDVPPSRRASRPVIDIGRRRELLGAAFSLARQAPPAVRAAAPSPSPPLAAPPGVSGVAQAAAAAARGRAFPLPHPPPRLPAMPSTVPPAPAAMPWTIPPPPPGRPPTGTLPPPPPRPPTGLPPPPPRPPSAPLPLRAPPTIVRAAAPPPGPPPSVHCRAAPPALSRPSVAATPAPRPPPPLQSPLPPPPPAPFAIIPPPPSGPAPAAAVPPPPSARPAPVAAARKLAPPPPPFFSPCARAGPAVKVVLPPRALLGSRN